MFFRNTVPPVPPILPPKTPNFVLSPSPVTPTYAFSTYPFPFLQKYWPDINPLGHQS